MTSERSGHRGRIALWGALGLVALLGAVAGAWIVSLPAAPVLAGAPPIADAEIDSTLAALKPPKRERPLVAIIGLNDATETTDYLVPYGILRRSGIADVVALATEPGPLTLYPALKVEPQATVAEFDARFPDGADYVVVPAMSRDDHPAVLDWLRSQAGKGATVIGVCAGAKIVAAAGLLDGKRATTHWYYLEELRKKHPTIRTVPDRRLVVDQGVATTTGITASMPMMLTLIEAIAGRNKAESVARDLGLAGWDARHDSEAFELTRPFALTVVRNRLAFWNHEVLGVELAPGIDEVSLALVADAWSRTYRSRVVTFASAVRPQVSLGGLAIVPDQAATAWPTGQRLPTLPGRQPARALDQALADLEARYGKATAELVAMQLEYPDFRIRRSDGR